MIPVGRRALVVAALGLAVSTVVIVLVARVSAAPNDTTGDFVLGQTGFASNGTGLTASTLNSPSGIAIDGANNVYVADAYNNRVLQYDNPMNTDAVADRVFGQGGSFTSKVCNLGGITASSLCNPLDVAVDSAGNLFVVDWQNNRVLEYFTPTTTDTVADRVFGQGGSFTTGTYTTTATANTLTNPMSVAVDTGGNLYIADRGMHRILQYNPPLSNTTADRVFGQQGSFTSGIPNLGGVSADSIAYPVGIGVDIGGNLYVSDSGNSRALMYKAPTTTDTTADVVFGQLGSFTTANPNTNGITADSLDAPTDIDADNAGNVYITDTGSERTLVYDYPLALGTTADVVFGQLGSFTSWGYNTPGLNADAQGDPWAIEFDAACNLWIVDFGNNRVVEYDKPPHACVDAPLPTPTASPAPTPPVLNTAPGTTTVSFNGGTSLQRGVSVTFGTVTGAGNTSVVTGHSGPPPPPGLQVMGVRTDGSIGDLHPPPPDYYDISTTAVVSGTNTVCIHYDGSAVMPGNTPKLMHYTGGAWSDITTAVMPDPVICGETTSFSPFAVMQAGPPVGGVVDVVAGRPSGEPHWVWLALAGTGTLAAMAWVAGARAAARRRSR